MSAFDWVPDIIGRTSAVTRAITASTTTTSMSVKPCCAKEGLPVRDTLVFACPAGNARGAQGVKVVVAVIAGNLIDIGPAPWVGRNGLLLQIRSVPRINAHRMLDQRRE